MRAWRPAHKCIYVIPEVRGNIRSFEKILNRIMPMRFSSGQEDMLVLLGDYIDGQEYGAEVMAALVNIKEEYGDKVIIIRGDHEDRMLNAINGSDADYNIWMDIGGRTTIASYINMLGIKAKPHEISKNRLLDIVPKNHVDLINKMPRSFKYDDYMFIHGSFNHNKTLSENNQINFTYDYTASKFLKQSIRDNGLIEFKDNCVVVGTHNFMGKKPYLHHKYFMLGEAAPNTLYIFELNSLSASYINNNKSKLHKYKFKVVE
jgi:hypothetical protein